jgi:serine/threonine protein kinase
MLVGIPPYYNNNRKILFDNIKQGPLRIPHTMSKVARDLILNLLNRNPTKRMGASSRDAAELKEHEFFKGKEPIDWDDVYNMKLEMPEIEVKTVTYNPEAEKAFKEGELASKQTMEKIYK